MQFQWVKKFMLNYTILYNKKTISNYFKNCKKGGMEKPTMNSFP